MIDIHSHVIFGVDDGPSTIEQSVAMISSAEKAGIRTIVATPHSHEALFETDKLIDHYEELLYRTRASDIILKLGYEVFINPSIQGADRKNPLTLDDSSYLLYELPFNATPKDGFDVLYSFRLKEIIPILAHPERNRNFLKAPEELSNYINAGCMIQVDAASILGVYGRDVRDFTKKLLKANKVDYVASNAHCALDYSAWYARAFKQVAKWTGDEVAGRLFRENAQGIVNQEKKVHVV